MVRESPKLTHSTFVERQDVIDREILSKRSGGERIKIRKSMEAEFSYLIK